MTIKYFNPTFFYSSVKCTQSICDALYEMNSFDIMKIHTIVYGSSKDFVFQKTCFNETQYGLSTLLW